MSERRYIVQLDPAGLGDQVEIHLPDGRVVIINARGEAFIETQDPDSWVRTGYARMHLPAPEPSSSDHEGFVWEAIKTRRRNLL